MIKKIILLFGFLTLLGGDILARKPRRTEASNIPGQFVDEEFLTPDEVAQRQEGRRAGVDKRSADIKKALALSEINKKGETPTTIQLNLERANLYDALLEEANLTRVNLSNGLLAYALLNSAILSYADLKKANLTSADFSESTLIGVDMRDAELNETNFKKANLSQANLSGRPVGTLVGPPEDEDITIFLAWQSKTNFEQADLSDANLSHIFWSRGNFKRSNLKRAKLIGAFLEDASLTGADVEGADFRNAVMTEEQIKYAKAHGAIHVPERGWPTRAERHRKRANVSTPSSGEVSSSSVKE